VLFRSPGADVPAGPSVRRLARQLGVDLTRVAASGETGRITTEDLYAAVREHNLGDGVSGEPTALQPPAGRDESADDETHDGFGPVRREPISRLRATIADRMHTSATTIPHVTHFDQADITELDEFRRERKDDLADENIKLTLMPFLIKAVADALAKHPKLNATLDLDAGQVVYHDYVSLGIAVDTERGLIVPVLRDIASLGIAAIARKLAELVEKTRSGDFGVEDLRGGTFTISNQGAVGGQYATPIISHPESAILLLGRSALQPVVRDGKVTTALLMPLSLSYDHRLIDGADAGRFVNSLKELLESPGKLLLNL
jgi:pyruvate dehydrogenase E2 component (dihydrolipoamide acetyltransferase)